MRGCIVHWADNWGKQIHHHNSLYIFTHLVIYKSCNEARQVEFVGKENIKYYFDDEHCQWELLFYNRKLWSNKEYCNTFFSRDEIQK